MMRDIIMRLGQSVVQHGNHNDRIYVMRLAKDDMPRIVHRLYDMALENSYSKIFVKVPGYALDTFIKAGYGIEAYVPGFFNGIEGGYFMAKYTDWTRSVDKRSGLLENVLAEAKAFSEWFKVPALKEHFTFHTADPDDAKELAGLYRRTFSTYPFPIMDAEYIKKSMGENVKYYFMCMKGRMVGAASAEMDHEQKNVEMTDFATLEGHRSKGISAFLLKKMEESMAAEGMKLSYTIARATSYPMNKVFSRAGYAYGGRLVNNTNICGAYESMNVWYKPLGAT
ncbi:GCN5-related N-acetyltransferase family protein [Methanocella paludicola SANAE]|uniref:GCN5-related N-acetyltransferase family protein n=1 Tax=Methanocella paludicola (strain DSM 17711 / JCM 13418 / NBRC 101707 / SANAE) TaxID=304371 RepID=D1YZW8_METPS|nr:putative beta-lysine N-acetyltransferase [Methanocella paludicola]BAI61990.1 GCN5-related N-acetyltransferase family protein [Methanocella paludicola SANAE]